MRRSISAVSTGGATLSYSLQQVEERLQKRAGTIWTRTVREVEARARATMAYWRALREARIARPRTVSRRNLGIFSILEDFGVELGASRSVLGWVMWLVSRLREI